MEKREKEEDEVEIKKTTQSQKGRKQVMKMKRMIETIASPHGRRIEPRIDRALMAKGEAQARAKSRKMVCIWDSISDSSLRCDSLTY